VKVEVAFPFTQRERDLLLLALAVLAFERPQWLPVCGLVADRVAGFSDPRPEPSGRALFEQFRRQIVRPETVN
jgi:hypothetical protein